MGSRKVDENLQNYVLDFEIKTKNGSTYCLEIFTECEYEAELGQVR